MIMRRGWCARLFRAFCPCFRNKRNGIHHLRRSQSSLANADGVSLNVILYGECGVGKTSLRNRWVDGEFTGDVAPTFGVDFNIKTLELVRQESDEVPGRQETIDEEKVQREEKTQLGGGNRGVSSATAGLGSIAQIDHDDSNARGGGAKNKDGEKYTQPAPYTGMEVKINVYDTSGRSGYRAVNGTYLLAFDAVLFVYDVASAATLDELRRFFANPENRSKLMERKQAGAAMLLVGNKSDLSISDRQVGIQTGQDTAAEFGIPFMEVSAKTGANVKAAFMSVATRVVADRLAREALILDGKRSASRRRLEKFSGLEIALRATASVRDVFYGTKERGGAKDKPNKVDFSAPRGTAQRRCVKGAEEEPAERATTILAAPLPSQDTIKRTQQGRGIVRDPAVEASSPANCTEDSGARLLLMRSSPREGAVHARATSTFASRAVDVGSYGRSSSSPTSSQERSHKVSASPSHRIPSLWHEVRSSITGKGDGSRSSLLRSRSPSPLAESADEGGPRRRSPRCVRSSDSLAGRPHSQGRRVSPNPSQASPSGSKSTTSLNSSSNNRSRQRSSALGHAHVPPAGTDSGHYPRSSKAERTVDGGCGRDVGEGEGEGECEDECGGVYGTDASSLLLPSKGSQSSRPPIVSRGRSPRAVDRNRVSRSYSRSPSPVRQSASSLRRSPSPARVPMFPSHLVASALYPSGSASVPSPLSRSRSRSPSAACRSPREMLNPHTLEMSLGSRPATDGRTSHDGVAGSGAKTEMLKSSELAQRAREATVGVGLANLPLGSPDSRGSLTPTSETHISSTSPAVESAALLLKQTSSFWLDKWGIKAAKTDASRGRHARARRGRPPPSTPTFTIPESPADHKSPY